MKNMVNLILTLSLVVILANCGAAREQMGATRLSRQDFWGLAPA